VETEIKVALSNLFSDNPTATGDMQKEALIGKIIYVYNPVFDIKYFSGIARQVVKCQWHFIEVSAKFINESNAALMSISGNTGKEIYQTLVNSSPYDLEAALEWEANFGYEGDVLVNEYAYLTEDYTEVPDDGIIEDEPNNGNGSSDEDQPERNTNAK
jgi:hypothetical protein